MDSQVPRVLHIHFWADIRNSAGSVEKVITAFASQGQRYCHLSGLRKFTDDDCAVVVAPRDAGLLNALDRLGDDAQVQRLSMLDRAAARVGRFSPGVVTAALERTYDASRQHLVVTI